MATTHIGLLFREAPLVETNHPVAIVACSVAITIGAIALGFVDEGVNEYGWRAAAENAQRAASLLFLLPFLAGPIARLSHVRDLLIDRRAYGLGFAFAFAGYLAVIVAPHVISGHRIPPTLIAWDAIAGLLLVLQVVTANGLSKRALGSAWSGLHTFAMYAYWAYFTLSFFDRVVGPSRHDPFMPVGFGLMVAALLIRFIAAFAVKMGMAEKVV
jgi:DMSO/TMAO reductase YedYZ heme-binding membrane subunit